MNLRVFVYTLVLGIAVCYMALSQTTQAARVVTENSKIYIVDQLDERWDVTQAKSLGFVPEWFRYGIGRNAFSPPDDSHLTENNADIYPNLRVIGVADGEEAKAYSVPKLSGHEVANSFIGAEAIAVGY